MTAGKNDKKFIAHFKGKKYFTKEDLNSYFEVTGDTITDGALRIRIHKWKKKGIIKSIARGKYEIKTKPQFEPQVDNLIKKLNKKIYQHIPSLIAVFGQQSIYTI